MIDWDAYITKVKQSVIAGMEDAGAIFKTAAEVKARATFHGQTGATFAGIFAAVGGSAKEFSAGQEAIQEVLLLNPLHAYSEAAPPAPDGVIRMWGSVPTDYIEKLESDPTHAFLARTLDEEQGNMKAAVDTKVGAAT